MRNRIYSSTFLVLLFVLFLVIPVGQSAFGQDCTSLADLRIEDTNLLSATVVPASEDLPEYCRVLGYVRPAINFEVRLPTSQWNGKFFMAGCGGFCGKLESNNSRINAMNIGLKRNYAASTTDAGHWGETVFDGRWGLHNRVAEIDYGYRAVHETARVTKNIIESYYGNTAKYSYFMACSNGGRQANMEAWRYPEDFDGIISGCPALNLTELSVYTTWLATKNRGPDGKDLITPAETELARKAVYEACDGIDGIEDGLISDPGSCTFNPGSLACEHPDQADCLSQEQVAALRAFYQGPENSSGERLYPGGVPFGSEPYWELWITGETDEVSDGLASAISTNGLRYLVFEEDPGSTYPIEDFDFDRDPPRLEHMGKIFNADHPNLEAFRKHGGKMLMWQAWADAIVPPLGTIAYYNAVEKEVGNRQATQDFLRLYMIPGMDHCGILDGPGIMDDGFDPLTAMEKWVEQGQPPERLLTTKTDSTGAVQWTRPVCPYPQRAVYDGEGDVNEASNFKCINPNP
ncbi:tannase/feruloyl esterase family alpha/beta hydrolase [Aliifodinibius sp. S!AR15-10]|uniref:tannase/feruloyl esterase family alpha/beta hydrolase n=1 Tax=Aliifodinibius sp. S!AR15-10 TaxID=2950437 RepID=UPI00285490D4|nr:tannase/feruloyl esterase family alpha/beta hydrolase [Aliifodinibius sp. S!AR15-10]MDR8393535.1 tannase/feruloyl esterase family alpha/beta hydrolase [Aliifodinibius sp. S!AR15-10]